MTRKIIAGQYVVQDVIGHGGMGTVYRAEDRVTGIAVAIKALKPEAVIKQPELMDRFRREAEILQKLDHPNIVKLVDFITDRSGYYIVMELVTGGSLADYTKANGPLAPRKVIQIALEVADALARAHHLGVIHRDVKPANILLTDTNTPKLTDFGVSLLMGRERLTSSGLVVGTPSYMSPEVLKNSVPAPPLDIWSFGVTLFEIMSGAHPFPGSSMEAKLVSILTQPHASLEAACPEAPQPLIQLIDAMLEKDPLQRMDSMRRVASILEDILQGKPIQSYQRSPEPVPVDVDDSAVREKVFAVIFYTDIEKSTLKWEQYPALMGSVIRRHDEISEQVLGQHGGRILRHRGDGISAMFEIGDPLGCAIAMQKRFALEDWGEIGELKIRVALHMGNVERHVYDSAIIGQAEEYFGTAMNRAARILDTGYGGQILLTPAVADSFDLPLGANLHDLGEHTLKDVTQPQRILGLLHPDLAYRDFPPLKSLSSVRNNLPQPTSVFIGREVELSALDERLDHPECRLLTITGPGGMGKTRLALETALQKVRDFADGIFFIDLAVLETEAAIVPAIASAMDFQFQDSPVAQIDQLQNYLNEKEILLILDNFEHLMDGVHVVDRLLNATPHLKIIATSREALNLPQEWRYPLHGLLISNQSTSAMQLFIERAQRVRPEFDPQANHDCIRDICTLLDGIPLAIELAAAWLRSISCSELLDEISHNLDVLTSRQRNIFDRHRSLRAVFDYSWQLLTDSEQDLLMKLSVFKGSFKRKAAEQIASASLISLSSLIDKSLLYIEASGRYRLHELVKQFSLELFANAPFFEEVQQAYSGYFADLLDTLRDQVIGLEQIEAFQTIEVEFENIRAAWYWAAVNQSFEIIDKILPALDDFILYSNRYQIGIELMQVMLAALPDGHQRQRALLLRSSGSFLSRLGSYDDAFERLEQAANLAEEAGDDNPHAEALILLGFLTRRQGDYDTARVHLESALELASQTKSEHLTAKALQGLASLARYLGDHAQASEYEERALQIFEELGDRINMAHSINSLGIDALYGQGDFVEARRRFERSLTLSEELSERWGIASTLINLGDALRRSSDLSAARDHYEKSLSVARDIGWQEGIVYALGEQALVTIAQEEFSTAQQLLKQALNRAQSVGNLPSLLTILVNVARYSLAAGNPVSDALQIIGFALNHPSIGSWSKEDCEQLIAALENDMNEEEVQQHLVQGVLLDLSDVTTHAHQILGKI